MPEELLAHCLTLMGNPGTYFRAFLYDEDCRLKSCRESCGIFSKETGDFGTMIFFALGHDGVEPSLGTCLTSSDTATCAWV